MSSLLINGVKRFATCWTITRKDAVMFRFTDHDTPLIIGGDTYSPAAAVDPTARQRQEGLEPGNVDIKGAITSDDITDEDLRAGRFRGARVTEVVVDWRYPEAGTFAQSDFVIDETSFDQEVWTAKMSGLKGRLSATLGFLFTRKCRWKYGGPECGVDTSVLMQPGVVAAVTENRRVFQSDIVAADKSLRAGLLVWSSGENAGFECDVKTNLLADGTVELQVPTPFPIGGGDEFTIRRGCRKRFLEDCIGENNNGLNFGGFPYMRGEDAMYQTPDSK